MSLDVAKKLYEELMADETKKVEYLMDSAAFLTAGGYDCTPDEIKEVMTMDRKLDEKELLSANGGLGFFCPLPPSHGNGKCTETYYQGDCISTVASRDWCLQNDFCDESVNVYRVIRTLE